MNFENFSPSDVFDALEESGYEVTTQERNFTTANDLFAYLGDDQNGNGHFLVGFRDSETLYGVDVSEVVITPESSSLTMCRGSYGSMPVFGGSFEESSAYIETRAKRTITVAELKRNLINTLAVLNKFDDNISFEGYRSFALDVKAGDDESRFKLVSRFVKQ